MKLDELPDDRSAAKNVHGTAIRKEIQYELTRENKKSKKRSHGLTGSVLSNMSKADYGIKHNDLKARVKVGDTTIDCAGIVYKNDHTDG